MKVMRTKSIIVLGLATAAAVTAVWAGSPHFVGEVTATRAGDTLTVTGKEAGLGNEAQVHIVLSATAQCFNSGGHHPKAANKESVTAEGVFPVQNGKADFMLSATASFQPDCSPPMTVVFTDVTVTDTTNGLSQSLPGPF
jgi:hypothetical protein